MDNVFNFLKRIPELLEESKIIILMVDGLGSIDLRIPRAKKRVYQTVSLRVLPHSFFTKATSEGAEVREIKYLSQVFPLGEADFVFIYWPSVDSIRHERYEDEALWAEVGFIELFVKQLIKRMPKKTKLYILSDHGLTLCKQRHLLPAIDSILPAGGERVVFYKELDVGEVENEIRRRGIPADVFKLEELEYFKGEINPRCYKNYGHVMVVAKEHVCFKYPFERGDVQELGAHGGLSDSERAVVNLLL